jgi:hypothetical protein
MGLLYKEKVKDVRHSPLKLYWSWSKITATVKKISTKWLVI